MKSYRDLDVWKRGMDIATSCYQLTKPFPQSEIFGLTSQIRRAAVSMPANVAEGWARESDVDFTRFLRIAHGSLRELETLVLLSERVGFSSKPEINGILGETEILSKQLHAFKAKLKGKD